MTQFQPYVSMILTVVATFLNSVGLITTEWSVAAENKICYGLWLKCEREFPCIYYIPEKDIFIDTLRMCQFFATVTIVLCFVCCLVGLFLIRSTNDTADDTADEDSNWPLYAFLSSVAAATSVLILIVVWYITIHNTTKSTLGYSFKLTAASGICLFTGGLVAFST